MVSRITGNKPIWGEAIIEHKPIAKAPETSSAPQPIVKPVIGQDLLAPGQSRPQTNIPPKPLEIMKPAGLKGHMGVSGAAKPQIDVQVKINDKPLSNALKPVRAELKELVSSLKLTKAQEKLALNTLAALASNAEAEATFLKTITAEGFKKSTPAAQSAFLAMSGFNANNEAITLMATLIDGPNKSWFSQLNNSDKERTMRLLGELGTQAIKNDTSATYAAAWPLALLTYHLLAKGQLKISFADAAKYKSDDGYKAAINSKQNGLVIRRDVVADGIKDSAGAAKGLANANDYLRDFTYEAAMLVYKSKSYNEHAWDYTYLNKFAQKSSFLALDGTVRFAAASVLLAQENDAYRADAEKALNAILPKPEFQQMAPAQQANMLNCLTTDSPAVVSAILTKLLESQLLKETPIEQQENLVNLITAMNMVAKLLSPETAVQEACAYALDSLMDGRVPLKLVANGPFVQVTDRQIVINDSAQDMTNYDIMMAIAQLFDQILDLAINTDFSVLANVPHAAELETYLQNISPLDREKILQNIANSQEAALPEALWKLFGTTEFQVLDDDIKDLLLSNLGDLDGAGVALLTSILTDKKLALANDDLRGILQLVKIGAPADKGALIKAAKELITDGSFKQSKIDVKEAIWAQCQNYPSPVAVKSLKAMVAVPWFKEMDLSDKQRAAKAIALFSIVGLDDPTSKQRTIIENTINRLLSNEIPLNFADIEDDPGRLTYGYAMPNTKGIWLNRALILDGNDAVSPEDIYALEAIIDTIPHEVSHQVNGDVNEPTYRYFQGEYRAWYVAWIAYNGREPTRQEAFDRMVELINIYPNLNYALFDVPEERRKIVEFVNLVIKLKRPKFGTQQELIEFFSKPIINGDLPAPPPDSKLNPDMDN